MFSREVYFTLAWNYSSAYSCSYCTCKLQYAVIHDYTCTLHPMILILDVVEFSFNKNTNILFKEVNMYLKLPWKLLGAWEKKRVACPGRKIYLAWMMQNSLQLAQKLCWYICPQTWSVLRSKQTLDIHKITSKHITSLEIFS